MLAAERRQHILATLQRDGKVLATELSAALNVSEDTIRRDLREMAEAGLLQRVHGGALLRSPASASFAVRESQSPTAKEEIARAAVQLIRDGQVIILDGGTTTLHVAQRLPIDLRATVVTNCPPIAVALAGHPHVEVMMIGGRFYKHSLVTIGASAVETLRHIRADICLLGVCSLHPQYGISVPDAEEVYVKRAMIAGSAEVAALASAEKLGTIASFIVEPITELTHIVTECDLSEEMLSPYRTQGITVIC